MDNKHLNRRLRQIGKKQTRVNNFKDQVAAEFCPYQPGETIKFEEYLERVTIVGTIVEILWNENYVKDSSGIDVWKLKLEVLSAENYLFPGTFVSHIPKSYQFYQTDSKKEYKILSVENMHRYPTVSKDVIFDIPVYIFDKLDGSNIRAEWRPKTGFSKFGSRKVLMDDQHEDLGDAIQLFKNKYANDLEKIFRKERWQKVTVFFEYHSPNSFAGFHADEPHDVTLIDVDVYKKGFLPPNDYYNIFKHLDIAKLLYRGNLNKTIIDEVKAGTFEGMTFEGVVCKAMKKRKYYLFKIKNKAWIDKLKEKCGDDEKLFNELL